MFNRTNKFNRRTAVPRFVGDVSVSWTGYENAMLQ